MPALKLSDVVLVALVALVELEEIFFCDWIWDGTWWSFSSSSLSWFNNISFSSKLIWFSMSFSFISMYSSLFDSITFGVLNW